MRQGGDEGAAAHRFRDGGAPAWALVVSAMVVLACGSERSGKPAAGTGGSDADNGTGETSSAGGGIDSAGGGIDSTAGGGTSSSGGGTDSNSSSATASAGIGSASGGLSGTGGEGGSISDSLGGATGTGGMGGSGGVAGAFYESFEDGDLSPWASGPEGGGVTLTDELAAGGSTRSLRVPGGVDYFAGPNIIFDPIQARYVSWWLRFNGALPGNNGLAHFALSADEAAEDPLVHVWAARDGFLLDAGSFQPIGGEPPEQDTWYHVEVNIDWQTRIATLSVDGTQVLEGELASAGEGVVRIDLFTVENATSYFDEIELVP
jgi:hypothetical protein